MKHRRIITGALLLSLPFGVVTGASWLWHGRDTRPSLEKGGAVSSASGNTTGLEPGTDVEEMIRAAAATLVIDYRDDVTDADLVATPELEQPVSRWSARDRLYRVRFATAGEAASAAARLAADPRVESVDWEAEATIFPAETSETKEVVPGVFGAGPRTLDARPLDDRSMQAECGIVSAADAGDAPADPCYRYQWHLAQVGLPAAWQLGQGAGAVVAVIDTGVSRVPDLAQTKFVPGYNFVGDNADAADDHGHGTHVAGTIAQSTHNKLGVSGVAYKASIMPLKVLSARGSGSMAAIAQAIRFAADNGANVINMSLGGPFPVGAIGSAVKYARAKGVTIVAAAGNDGRGKVGYPARYPGVIAVAATQFDEKTTFYSNWGAQIDIAAPGGNVRVDQNGDGKPDGVLQNTVVPGNTSRTDYLWFMGTSMATPHVAGVAALIVGAGVTKPDAVEELLLDTARQPKTSTRGLTGAATAASPPAEAAGGRIDDHYGAGLVDARAALGKIKNGRGAGELGMGALVAMFGLSFLSRRGRGGGTGIIRPGAGFVVALVLGSSGLFLLPALASAVGLSFLAGGGVTGDVVSSGALGAADRLLPLGWRGSPLVWSALLPVGLTALLYGSGRLRGLLAGFGFGVAGALLFAAIASTFDIRLVPDLLDTPWLVANALLAALVAGSVLRR